MSKTLFAVLVACWTWNAVAEPFPLVRVTRSIPRGPNWRPHAAAQAPVNVVGMNSVTGLPETWLLELHGSFGSVEDVDRAMAGAGIAPGTSEPLAADEMLASSRTLLGIYRPWLSYRPAEAAQLLAKARYVFVSVVRIRPGMEAEFAESVKLRKIGYDTVNLDRPDIAYQVISGAAGGTYLFLAPLQSLRTLDNGTPRAPVYAESVVGPRPGRPSAGSSEAEILREHLLFRVEPRLSYVSDEFAVPDPEFWHPKQP